MLLTITTTHKPATDLGYLLHKNPARCQSFTLAFGKAHVFYTEATPDRTTVALLLEIDPIGLVRRRGPSGNDGVLDQYVNDRPYVASSFLSVAMGSVFRTAMTGKSAERQSLAETAIPLQASLPTLPCRGGEKFLRALFEPLGYIVEARRLPLDEQFPDWGDSPYFSVTLRGVKRLDELLTHLYMLMPVLDNDKHYWVGEDEVDKLLRHGGEWLSAHPQREQISRRYLKHQKSLSRMALERLLPDEQEIDAGEETSAPGSKAGQQENALESGIRLNDQRLRLVAETVQRLGSTSVIDLGCGEGRLLSALLGNRTITRLVGMDVSVKSLEYAAERLNLDRLPTAVRSKIELLHGSLTYRDKRLTGFDVATVIEVIEHLDAERLAAFERVLFEFARPRAAVVTTPNVEYNAKFESLPSGQFRHPDHRFEWTRKEFQDWAAEIASRFGYTVGFWSVGSEDERLGAPTQMAVFEQAVS